MAKLRRVRKQTQERRPTTFARRSPGVVPAAVAAAILYGLTPVSAQAQSCGTISEERLSFCGVSSDQTLTVTAEGSIVPPNATAVQVSGANATVINHGLIQSTDDPGVFNSGTSTILTNTKTISGGTGVSNGAGATLAKLTNSGDITATMSQAVLNVGGGTITEITNSGTIVSPYVGLANGGHIATVTNTSGGTLSTTGTSTAWALSNNGTIDKIVNDGTIEGGAAALSNNSGGTIGEIVNTGIIRASNLGSQVAIDNHGIITQGIKNSGTIDGSIELGSATLYLDGQNGRVTGSVWGLPNSAIVVRGKFTMEAGFSATDLSVNKGGHLTIRAGHLVEGQELRNRGTVEVRAGETVTIDADYRQYGDASLRIGATSASEHGKLKVNGIANFDDGAKVVVAVTEGGTLAIGNETGSIIEADTLDVEGDTLIVTDDSELFDFKATIKDNTVSLVTVLDETPDEDDGGGDGDTGGEGGKGDGDGGDDGGGKGNGNGGSGGGSKGGAVSNRVIAQGFGQGLGAARVLDGFVAGANNTGDMVNVVTAFGRLGSQQEVADAVAQTLPLMSANLNQVTLGSMQGVNRVIQARQGGLGGMSSGDGFLADKHLWFKPLASFADQDDRDGIAGYRANTYGFLFGGDAVVGKSSRLGLAFSYARTEVDGKSTARYNSADVDAYQLIAYGSHSIAAWPDVEVNWQADIGINSNEGKRTMSFGGLNRTAESDFDSTTAHLGAGISKGFQVRENTRLTPALRLDYFRIHNESYTEKGADTLNLRVKSQTSEQLIAMLEGRVQHRLNERTALGASVGVGYGLIGDQDSVTASYVGGGAAFNTPGMKASRWLGRAGLGLSYQATEGTEITARYDVEARSGFVAQTASVNVRWAF